MDDERLDPAERHTVKDLMARWLQTRSREGSRWPRLNLGRASNHVDLTQPGSKGALINSARMQRNLPLFDIIPAKFEQPPPAPVTRDGHPSAVAIAIAHIERPRRRGDERRHDLGQTARHGVGPRPSLHRPDQ